MDHFGRTQFNQRMVVVYLGVKCPVYPVFIINTAQRGPVPESPFVSMAVFSEMDALWWWWEE